MMPDSDILIEIQRCLQEFPSLRLQYAMGRQDWGNAYESLQPFTGITEHGRGYSCKWIPRDLLIPLSVCYDDTKYHQGTSWLLWWNSSSHIEICWSNWNESIRTPHEGLPLSTKWLDLPSLWCYRLESAWNQVVREWQRGGAIKYSLFITCPPTTGSRLNCFNGGKRSFPLCDCIYEDRNQIMRCHHPSARMVRCKDCILIGNKYYCLMMRTYRHLPRLLVDGFESWHTGNTLLPVNSEHYPQNLQLVILQQNKDGWKHQMLGCFVFRMASSIRSLDGKASSTIKPDGYSSISGLQSNSLLKGLVSVCWNDCVILLWEEKN